MEAKPEVAVIGSATFDKIFRSLHGLPDVTPSAVRPIQSVSPVLELPQTFIVQTMRHAERGDFIFVQYIGGEGAMRIVLMPEVAEAIARQRDAISTKNRKRAGRERAAADKAAGKVPGFLKKKARR